MTDTKNAPENTPPVVNSNLKTRIQSALVFTPVVLGMIYFGGGGFTLMMVLAAMVGVYEWARMVLSKDRETTPKTLIPLCVFVTGLGVITSGMVATPVVPFVFMLALSFLVFAFNYAQTGPSPKKLILGMLYISLAIQIMVWIRNEWFDGLYHMMTLLFIVWSSDVFAYIFGRTFGGAKLAPKISPKKTWSGFVGACVGAGAVSAAFACPWFLEMIGNVRTLGDMGVISYAVMGAVLGGVGQAGDLLISYFKRQYDVKDTGTLIPGHGGILDRIDALLLVAIVFGVMIKPLTQLIM